MPEEIHRERHCPAPAPSAAARAGARPPRKWARADGLLGLAAGVTLVSLFAPLASAGIWDPYELRVAELGRRLASELYGATWLLTPSTNRAPVDLGDLASGELPFTSMALGFRLFGMHEWAGRLPLAVWGALGVVATCLVVAWFTDRVTAAFAAVVLATTPLYFVACRTMLGDGVVMATVAIAFAGLMGAVFGGVGAARQPLAARLRLGGWRGVALGVGVLGLLAGHLCRGPLFGIVVPAGGVGLGWAVWRANGHRERDVLRDVLGVGSLLVAAVALGVFVVALRAGLADPSRFRLLVGAPLIAHAKLLTFDAVLRQLGHALFPYSALLPFALGRILAVPVSRGQDAQTVARADRESALRIGVLAVLSVALAASGLSTTYIAQVPFVAVFATAVVVAMALRDLERGAPVSVGLAMGAVALAAVLAWDLTTFPERSFAPFGFEPPQFPRSMRPLLEDVTKGAALGAFGLAFVTLIERGPPRDFRLAKADYLAWPRALWSAHQGNLFFAAVVAEAALVGLALLTWASGRLLELPQLASLSTGTRRLAVSGWLLFPVALLLVPAGGVLLRDVFRLGYARLPMPRARGALGAVAAAGLAFSLGYYPALADQLSPRSACLAYRARAAGGEALAVLDVGREAVAFYTGQEVERVDTAAATLTWLGGGAGRRWVVARSNALAELNSLYRADHRGKNLPVLAGGDGEFLLATGRLVPGEVSENPLGSLVLEGPVVPAHPVSANLGNKLDTLGWEVVGADGSRVESVIPGRTYEFRIYWRVVDRIAGEWQTFIHIDGHGQRHNGDHATLGGRYPLHYWLVGDVLRDTHEFSLEPNFAPGTYDVYYGLFMGDRRLEVKRGPSDDDRILAGKIQVR